MFEPKRVIAWLQGPGYSQKTQKRSTMGIGRLRNLPESDVAEVLAMDTRQAGRSLRGLGQALSRWQRQAGHLLSRLRTRLGRSSHGA